MELHGEKGGFIFQNNCQLANYIDYKWQSPASLCDSPSFLCGFRCNAFTLTRLS